VNSSFPADPVPSGFANSQVEQLLVPLWPTSLGAVTTHIGLSRVQTVRSVADTVGVRDGWKDGWEDGWEVV